ncbi:endolytic transglycosylase MltG [Corynebacterium liangguodongii]|uniref:Endolytic murein transglycosylase n=1 Tax=Corynebacterium liangguodongii TaxID=2079535 RepID=A0A2S0WEL3_9CORY|nr:endolytic transglycosylase MltG [Corynebacterium liangguodongii]AWB84102.1 endolytic transglycosylase MltG [Corynebacterium liangguodongii]PWC00113.1 endolytic transglycosylase MltG [Corynebacterium liangguodongii]
MNSRQLSRQRTASTAIIVASILLIVGLVAWIAVASNGEGGDFRGDGNGEEKVVEVVEGSSVSELGPQLEEKGVVKSNSAFQSAAMAHPDSHNIQPGFYRLEAGMSADAAVKALLDPAHRITPLMVNGGTSLMDVNVVGGQTRQGIYTLIQQVSCGDKPNSECASVDKLQEVAKNADPKELGVPEWAVDSVAARAGDPKRLEGLIAPGEYIIDPHADASEVLRDLISRSAKQYAETDIVSRAQAVGLSPYELLIAASLVEREAPAGEFDKVARVILNRLAKPMRLEFDSTVNYDLPTVEVATGKSDRERPTPWNTYAKDGLPETPIASPSLDAITAMEHPAEGNWLFFVTVDKNGTTVFNDTFEKHLEDTQRAYESGILDSQR